MRSTLSKMSTSAFADIRRAIALRKEMIEDVRRTRGQPAALQIAHAARFAAPAQAGARDLISSPADEESVRSAA